MKIISVESVVAEIPFRHPFGVWRGSVRSKPHAFIRVVTDSGLVGVGEAAPFSFYSPETAAGACAMIAEYMAPGLVGLDPRNVREAMAQFEVIDGHHIAKCAVEMALWDLLGQSLGAPIYRLIGGPIRTSVPLVVVLQTAEPQEMAAEARSWVKQGFPRLKIKLGFGLDADEAAVAHVREAVGQDPRIRVDAEERYTVKEALEISRRLERYQIELTSQPISRTDWEGMAFLRRALPIPLLADESIVSPADVLRCVRMGAADMVNIKVVKSGGLLHSLEMAAIARAAALPIVAGSMLETGIGCLFCAHFAVATPGVFSAELCGPVLFADDLVDRPLQIHEGALYLDESPGLGAGLANDRLARLRVS